MGILTHFFFQIILYHFMNSVRTSQQFASIVPAIICAIIVIPFNFTFYKTHNTLLIIFALNCKLSFVEM